MNRQLFEKIISAPPFEKSVERWEDNPGKRAWPGNYKDYPVQLAYEVCQDYAEATGAEVARLQAENTWLKDRLAAIERAAEGLPKMQPVGTVRHWDVGGAGEFHSVEGKGWQGLPDGTLVYAISPEPFERKATAATATLERLGYTYNGGVLWRPPLGETPDYVKDCPAETCFKCGHATHPDECVNVAPAAPAADLARYDAGYLNGHGGGNVGWWHDYIRAELERAHDFYQDQIQATGGAHG